MEIKLNNFGKIQEANIQLNGLTLIAGLNDTGKSTVGKCLFAIIKSITNYPKMYETVRKDHFNIEYLRSLKMEFKNLRFDFLHSDKKFFTSSPNFRIKDFRELHDFLFYPELFEGQEVFQEEKTESFLEKIILFCNKYKDYKFKHPINFDRIEKIVKEAKEYLRKKHSDNHKMQEICKRIFIDLFNQNLNNSLHNNDEATINYSDILKLRIKNDEISIADFINLSSISFSDVMFIDNPNILENQENFYDFYAFNNYNEISITKDAFSKIKNASKKISKENYHKNLLKTFQDVFIEAKFEYDKSQDKLKYKVTDKAKSLEISNIAMGSKSFGLLYILLKSGVLQKDSLLILDEPENHLHPEWQIKYAEIICKMIADGFYVLITSHSPYFIQALRKYAEDYQILENKTDFYFAEKTNKQNYSIISSVKDDLGNINTEKIFDSLYKPFEILDNE
jgi:predicted ATPase